MLVTEWKRPDWYDHARCKDSDPNLFFPGPGDSQNEAVKLCDQCPVRSLCFEQGMVEKFGIWGGASERDRRRVRRRRRLAS